MPGALLAYAVSHRGRDGVDTMQIQIGPPGAAANFTRDVTTGNTGWQQVLGGYRVPAGQTSTRFGFAALSSASSLISAGNFLDGVAFGFARCSVTLTKELLPAADPGRFDLLVGDEVIVPAAGDGSRSEEPVPVAPDAVRVSERAAAGASLDDYASAVSCRDAVSGKLLAQAAGPELLLSFDRPREAACTVANVRAPAVVGAGGGLPTRRRRPVRPARSTGVCRPPARATGPSPARSGSTPGIGSWCPRPLRPGHGPRTTCPRCSADRAPGGARSSRRRPGRAWPTRPPRIRWSRASLINLRRNPPAPSPAPQPDPVPAPSGGGVGELDLQATARPVTRGSRPERTHGGS